MIQLMETKPLYSTASKTAAIPQKTLKTREGSSSKLLTLLYSTASETAAMPLKTFENSWELFLKTLETPVLHSLKNGGDPAEDC